MKKDLRNKERELFDDSMQLHKLDLTNVDFEQAQQIRKMQDEAWKKHIFYKEYLAELDRRNSKKNKE